MSQVENEQLKLEFTSLSEAVLDKPEKIYSPDGMVIVIGAGGVGWWLVAALSRMDLGGRDLVVYDPDTFEGGNGAKRLPIPERLNKFKTQELEEWLTEWRLGDAVRIGFRARGYYAGELWNLKKLNHSVRLVIDCSDMRPSSRWQIWNECSRLGVPYVRVSYDAQLVTWSHTPPLTVVDDGGYEAIPNMAVTFMAGGWGAEMVRRTLDGEKCPDQTLVIGEKFWGGSREAEVSLNEGLMRGIEEAAEDAEDPWVVDADGVRIGRLSEFEIPTEEQPTEDLARSHEVAMRTISYLQSDVEEDEEEDVLPPFEEAPIDELSSIVRDTIARMETAIGRQTLGGGVGIDYATSPLTVETLNQTILNRTFLNQNIQNLNNRRPR